MLSYRNQSTDLQWKSLTDFCKMTTLEFNELKVIEKANQPFEIKGNHVTTITEKHFFN